LTIFSTRGKNYRPLGVFTGLGRPSNISSTLLNLTNSP
jgi:hypothetical protein